LWVLNKVDDEVQKDWAGKGQDVVDQFINSCPHEWAAIGYE